MVGISLFLSPGLISLLLQSTIARSDIPILHICREGAVTTNNVKLNMDTSPLAGANGSCQCRILFYEDSAFNTRFQNITSPDCGTEIQMSDGSFQFTCHDSSIQQIVYARRFTSGDILSIRVRSFDIQDAMSGTVHMRTDNGTNFTFECYEAIVTRTPTTFTTTFFTQPTTPSILTTSSIFRNRSAITTVGKSTTAPGVHMTSARSIETRKDVTKNEIPVALIAGVATGGVVMVVIGLVVVAVVKHRYRCIRRYSESSTTPESRDHPSYCDLSNREHTEYLSIDPVHSDSVPESADHPTYSDLTSRENTDYEHIEQSGQDNIYNNVAFGN